MWILLIFCWFSKMFNMHLEHLENSEIKAWNVIRMIINEKILNQNSKATLVTSKTGPKIGIKLNFALKSDLIQFSGLFLWPLNLLCYFGPTFSFIIILITFQAVISDFSRCFKWILRIFENQKKINKIHKFYFFIFSKIFLHNHYLKLFLDWFTRNCAFKCGGWTCWMKSVATKTSV